MSQSMREMREASKLVRMGRRLSLILSKESIFGSVGKEKGSLTSSSSSPTISPPLRRSTLDSPSPLSPPLSPSSFEHSRVFGVDLITAVQRSNKMHRALPDVLYKCFIYLDEKGLEEEGIFRLSGSATDILKIKGQFNQGVAYDLSTCLNPHTISGLLKLFLRELPQPLFPTEIDTSGSDLLGRIKAMVEALPKENKTLMGCLFWLLNKVSKAESVTKMGIQNLVIVFSATLNCSGTILTKIIKHATDIFPEDMLAKTEIEPKIDLSSKSITITEATTTDKAEVQDEEDIFGVDDTGKTDNNHNHNNNHNNNDNKNESSQMQKSPPQVWADGKSTIAIGRKDRGILRRTRTKSIFDSDDESEEIQNDLLLVTPSQSLPVRSRGYFL